jgi:cobalt-zinc-cadmium efflux system protein
MIIVASLGFVINFISAKLFHKDHHHDLNMKSAYLHLMADAAISLGVAVAGVIIYFYSISWIDPAFSIIISVVIIYGSGKIVLESLKKLRQ